MRRRHRVSPESQNPTKALIGELTQGMAQDFRGIAAVRKWKPEESSGAQIYSVPAGREHRIVVPDRGAIACPTRLEDQYSIGWFGKNKGLAFRQFNLFVKWPEDPYSYLTDFYVNSDGWAELGNWETEQLPQVSSKHLLVGATACAALVRAGAVLEGADTGAPILYEAIAKTLVSQTAGRLTAAVAMRDMRNQHFVIPGELQAAVDAIS